MLAERLFDDRTSSFASGWNFGPPEESERTVGWIIGRLYDLWGVEFDWEPRRRNPARPRARSSNSTPPRRGSSRLAPEARSQTTLAWIVEWTRAYERGENVRDVSLADIHQFMAISPPA